MLLKVEAINIEFFVNDTQNLSVIRGGSLMLLEMPRQFEGWLKGKYGEARTKLVRSGASQAIFDIETAENSDEVQNAAKEWLMEHYPYATIGVSLLANPTGSYFAAFQELELSIRRRQMQSFSFAGFKSHEAAQVCAWDRLRPADRQIDAKDGKFWVSAATEARRRQGLKAKSDLLNQRAGIGGHFEYTNDLDELSGGKQYGNLDHKIAVFYVDGNSFSKELRKALSTSELDRQRKVLGSFDVCIQDKQKEFVRTLLKATEAQRWQTEAGARRIEILLWGGDEMMLVVPAWCGWETAEIFCQVMKNARFRDDQTNISLKHAMGLVFAHHKAPIHGLTRLARALVDEAKYDRSRNCLSYLALESFDHIGESLGRFRGMRCPEESTRRAMVLTAEEDALAKLRNAVKRLKADEFPRSKVFQAALGLANGRGWADLKKELTTCLDEDRWKKPIDEWSKLAGGEPAAWYHLADLWDFVGVEA